MTMGKIIRVAHLIATGFYGGPEKQIVEHLKLINSDIYKGYVLSFIESGESNEIIEKAVENNIEAIGIPMSGPIDIRALIQLIRVIRENRIDLLCVHGYKACVLGWIAAKRTSIRIIAFSRGYTSENTKVRFYEWLERMFLSWMDGVICVSGGQSKKIKALNVFPKRQWVVHNAVRADEKSLTLSPEYRERIFNELNIPQGAGIVVSAGRLSPEKGHRFMIDAISLIRKEIENTYFILCGDGMCMDELKNRATEKGVDDICRFPGFRRDVQMLFKLMDFMVLPSLTEGLPNVVLESFACSRTVAATAVGGVPELVNNGVNGILVEPSNPEMLANAILDLTNAETANTYGAAGLNTVMADFSFERQAAALMSIYSIVMDHTA